MFKSILYLLVVMTIAIFSLIYFGVLKDFYEVFEDIVHYVNGGHMSPDFGFLSFYFYLFLLFIIFLSINLMKTKKTTHKLIDSLLILSISYLMYSLIDNTEFIVWKQFLAPLITVFTILFIGLLWRFRFPDTFDNLIEFFKKENSIEERTDL